MRKLLSGSLAAVLGNMTLTGCITSSSVIAKTAGFKSGHQMALDDDSNVDDDSKGDSMAADKGLGFPLCKPCPQRMRTPQAKE